MNDCNPLMRSKEEIINLLFYFQQNQKKCLFKIFSNVFTDQQSLVPTKLDLNCPSFSSYLLSEKTQASFAISQLFLSISIFIFFSTAQIKTNLGLICGHIFFNSRKIESLLFQ